MLIRKLQHSPYVAEHDIAAPHRDYHYLILVAREGSCRINLDFEALVVEAPALLLVYPGQVHYLQEMNQLQGWALSFDPSLIDLESGLLLEKYLTGPLPLDHQTAFCQQLVTLLDLMEQLQASTSDSYSSRTLQALLAALLSMITGKITHDQVNYSIKETRGMLIEQAFRQLLKKHYKTWKQPARYAEELAISVAHLNDTVKAITGIPVSAHIQQHSVLEAKRLLFSTDLTVKEIAYQSGYDEPVYFGKLFKKVTGLTPLQFRQLFR